MSSQVRSLTPTYKNRTSTKSFIYSLGQTSNRSSSKILNCNSPSKNSEKLLSVSEFSKFEIEMFEMQKKLTTNKDKLCSCFEIYQMLENSGQQHKRCLLHNNILSLYCQHQRRILCVSCLYGVHKHRSHKVIPLKDSLDDIYQDNKNLALEIEQQLQNLSLYQKMAQQNSRAISIYMNGVLLNIEKEYTNRIKQLTHKFSQYKQIIKDSFYPLLTRCKDTKKLLTDFKTQVQKAFNLYSTDNQNQYSNQDVQIMKQVLYTTILDLCDFRNRSITKTQLDNMFKKIQLHFEDF